ncbi:hypothetical protein [Homoserinibacter gongjuensis]|jgi:hypothetical protein|nr:hypothetical protein [Homoserinibacter gongjuensis]
MSVVVGTVPSRTATPKRRTRRLVVHHTLRTPIMNTTLTHTTRHDHPPHEAATEHVLHEPHAARRLSFVDRAALHLGMALIRWGRRPGRELARHERLANSFELGLLQREREALRRELERERALSMEHALIRVR